MRQAEDRLRRLFPNGLFQGRGLWMLVIFLLGAWLMTGFYRVGAQEQGVVLRFGEYVKTTPPGLNYHLPWPIETAITPEVTRVNRAEIGFVSREGRPSTDVNQEALMLTGDENIVNINFVVFWQIKNAGEYLFNVEDPPATVKMVAESAMREIIGKGQIQNILTQGRQEIEIATQALMQATLDAYGAGIQVNQVNLQKVDPPSDVIDAFRDVQAAQADRERAQNEAEAYRNDIVPRARGEAQRSIQQAEAYKQEVIANAEGEVNRFTSIYNEYRNARDVTARRLYIEMMEAVLSGKNKVVVDNERGGVVPYMPLPSLPQATPNQTERR